MGTYNQKKRKIMILLVKSKDLSAYKTDTLLTRVSTYLFRYFKLCRQTSENLDLSPYLYVFLWPIEKAWPKLYVL